MVTAAIAVGGAVGAVVDVSGRAREGAVPVSSPSPQKSPSASHTPRSGPAGTATPTPGGPTHRPTHRPTTPPPSPTP